MSQFPIFKINKLSNKNKIETIYVFYGSRFSELNNDPNILFKNANFLSTEEKSTE